VRRFLRVFGRRVVFLAVLFGRRVALFGMWTFFRLFAGTLFRVLVGTLLGVL
jgi:hypothetical protein